MLPDKFSAHGWWYSRQGWWKKTVVVLWISFWSWGMLKGIVHYRNFQIQPCNLPLKKMRFPLFGGFSWGWLSAVIASSLQCGFRSHLPLSIRGGSPSSHQETTSTLPFRWPWSLVGRTSHAISCVWMLSERELGQTSLILKKHVHRYKYNMILSWTIQVSSLCFSRIWGNFWLTSFS